MMTVVLPWETWGHVPPHPVVQVQVPWNGRKEDHPAWAAIEVDVATVPVCESADPQMSVDIYNQIKRNCSALSGRFAP